MKRLPFEVSVAKPCQQPWSDMSGTTAQRHCDTCNKTVHNFAVMTPWQIERLVVATRGDFCARIQRNVDGTLITLQRENSPLAALLTLSASLAVVAPALAQSPNLNPDAQQKSVRDGRASASQTFVTGTVTDSQGALVVGSAVTLIGLGETVNSTTTNSRGEFQLSTFPGEYQLHASAFSFAPVVVAIRVDEGAHISQNVTLHPSIDSQISVNAMPSDYETIGTFATTLTTRRRLAYRLRHPVAYAKYLLHPR